MPGKAKRKYVDENIRISKYITKQLNHLMPTLKPGYTVQDILLAYKKYYPFDWIELVERQNVYKEKDDHLRSVHKKIRYKPFSPEAFFYSLQKVKYVLSKGYREKHSLNYSETARIEYESQFARKRDAAIARRRSRIDENTKNIQKVDPGFIDALIYAYHRRENTINDKMEIIREIIKYDCSRTFNFLSKINDCEKNDEIRNLAFNQLQSDGHYVKLRQKPKGKIKSYITEESDIIGTPESLAERLSNRKSVQNLKRYDVFISHSYKDKNSVEDVVRKINATGMNCYVDWTADNDFLKRSMVSDYTKEVLKHRMKQSKCLLFLSSARSRASKWVSFELEYFEKVLKKPVYMHLLNGHDEHSYTSVNNDFMNLKILIGQDNKR